MKLKDRVRQLENRLVAKSIEQLCEAELDRQIAALWAQFSNEDRQDLKNDLQILGITVNDDGRFEGVVSIEILGAQSRV